MSSIFTKIINQEIPCHFIAESEHCFAFLDIRPVQPGHTLVISKQEIDKFFDLEDVILTDLMRLSKRISAALESVFPCNRVGIMVAGLEVPHAHMHLIPINQIKDLNFSLGKATDEDLLSETAILIRSKLV